MRKTLLLTAAMTVHLLSPALAATYECKFEKECLGTEACEATTFSLKIKGFDYAAQIETDSQTMTAHKFASADGNTKGVYSTTESADFHLITIEENGVSRYSVHMPTSNLAIYYEGKCGNIK